MQDNYSTPEDSPLVSVIVPSYNRASLILESLESVQNQTYQNWECIVVDDGSNDDTDDLMKDWIRIDNRFKYYKRHREPKGAPTCRNIGIENSDGKYVIFLDSDDLLANFCLERRVEFFTENPACDFLVFQSLIFNNRIHDLNIYFNAESEESDLVRFFRTESLWQVGGAIYKRKCLEEVSGFKEGLPFWQDVDLAVRLLLLNYRYEKFMALNPDAYVRQSKVSISRSASLTEHSDLAKRRIEILWSFADYAKQHHHVLDDPERATLWNFTYYLSGSLLTVHGQHKSFYKFWRKSCRIFNKGFVPFMMSYGYQYLIYCRKFSRYFIKLRNVYYSIFKRFIADPNELNGILLHQVKFVGEIEK